MHSYLIVGQETDKEIENILKDYGIKPINLMKFQEVHGIDEVREIKKILSVRTTSKGEYRAIIIEQAHGMTVEAQNAFLKTLEEPSGDTIIILCAGSESALLPTIISRCSLIFTPTTQTSLSGQAGPTLPTNEEKLFRKLVSAGIGEKVKFAEEMGRDRNEALTFVEGQLAFLHEKFRSLNEIDQFSARGGKLGKKLLSAYEDLSSNVNPKMVLFELLRHY